ncbi:hypothetical protein AAF712_007343 [Marasmius tenuissimus]|uniref:F-box domain-containing protein n=1 Tax=Marasmius tenuissimus TaxID=585030 RepID=A0ABR2ZVK3_9AGAR|nr:hypothetical protein PM082_013957 [Marasmius tenuissimus]
MAYGCAGCGLVVGGDIYQDKPPSSILDPLSKCNDPPSPLNRATLRREFEGLSGAIISLSTTINQLQASIDDLKSRRRELDVLVTAYKSVLNPCRQLPNEVLAEIFVLCTSGRDTNIPKRANAPPENNSYPSTLDTKQPPWVLGQVCARWRNLALSLPKLWSTIDLSWSSKLTRDCHAPFIDRRLVQTLQRAGNSPLSVSLRQKSCRDTTLSILCSRAFQWKEAKICIPADRLRILVPYNGMFSALSTLDLHLEGWDSAGGQGDVPDGVSVFHTASNLRALTLTSDSPMPARCVLQFPLHQLTTLKLMPRDPFDARPAYENLQTILPSLVNIEVCSFASFDFVLNPTKPRLTLSRLNCLEMVSKSSAIDAFLDSVTAPSLRILEMSPRLSPVFVQFLKRSSCLIEDLVLGYVSNDVLVEVLKVKELQAVKYLAIAGPVGNRGPFRVDSVSDDVLRILTLQPTGEILFPQLQRLALGGAKCCSDTALVDLLVSRRNISQFAPGTVSPLQRARIRICVGEFGIAEEAAKSKLRGLIEGGLLVTETPGGQAVVV